MITLLVLAWSIAGLWGTKILVKDIFGSKTDVDFSPEQIGGLIMLPLAGLVTLAIAYLNVYGIIDLKWDK